MNPETIRRLVIMRKEKQVLSRAIRDTEARIKMSVESAADLGSLEKMYVMRILTTAKYQDHTQFFGGEPKNHDRIKEYLEGNGFRCEVEEETCDCRADPPENDYSVDYLSSIDCATCELYGGHAWILRVSW